MPTKPDYGSFSKACVRDLAPLVKPLGFRSLGTVWVGRDRQGWLDAMFLQPSRGNEYFYTHIGVSVPELHALWGMPPHNSLVIGGRQSPLDVARSLATPRFHDKASLIVAFEKSVQDLREHISWFDGLKSIRDIAELYRRERVLGLEPSPHADMHKQVIWANYGFLLILSGAAAESQPWLSAALASMTAPV
jgi:hypothetical protein